MNPEAQPKPAKWSAKWFFDFPFNWIDSFESEAKRRVSHGLFVAFIVGTISILGAAVWSNKDLILAVIKGSPRVLNSPIQLSIQLRTWTLVLIVLSVVWLMLIIRWIRKKNRKIRELQMSIRRMEQTDTHTKSNGNEIIIATNELQRLRAEQESKVLEHTLTAVRTLYPKLLAMKQAFDAYIHCPPPEREERRAFLTDRLSDYHQCFLEHKIYLRHETTELLKKFATILQASTAQFSMAIAESKSPHRTTPEGKLFESFFKTNEEVPKLYAAVEDELQSVLGIEQSLDFMAQHQGSQLSHDRKVFERLNSIVDETTFLDFCKCARDYEFIEEERLDRILKLERLGALIENQFLTEALKKAFTEFHMTLSDLTTTTGRVFFRSGKRYLLHPEVKENPEGSPKRKIYEAAVAEVEMAVGKAVDAYVRFRQEVKSSLFL